MAKLKHSPQQEQALITELHDPAIKDDLEAFVLFAYPWGKANTPLHDKQGPRTWQRDYLQELTDHIRQNDTLMTEGKPPKMWRKATASGRGVGKSALVSWLSGWFMTTRLGSTTIVTANTEPQLKSRTFAEIGKWTGMLINAHWFEPTVLSIRPAPWFKEMLQQHLSIDCGYYYCQGQLWAEENPDAFAGAHNPFGMQVMFDETSGIPVPIFTVTEGFFTESVRDRYWHCFSNPRRNSGGFYDCFHDPKTKWRLLHLDSRAVEGIDPDFAENIIGKYGIDSDQARIEVLGQFPKQGDRQFIDNARVRAAQDREQIKDDGAGLVMGCDVARYGDDTSVIRFRQGRDARSIPPIRHKNRDNMFLANAIAHAIDRFKPDAVNIDAGNGTGVIDRLREMKYRVNEIWFGNAAGRPEWANRRTEMWAEMREWLGGGCLDRDAQLFTDLTAPEYDYFGKAKDQVMLETKESLKARGFSSPDEGDALALTFATRVSRRDTRTSVVAIRGRQARDIDYALFS